MLKKGDLGSAFGPYWEDVEKCKKAKAYWSLLHVTVCMPDICAALESDKGKALGGNYITWCTRNLPNKDLTGDERYRMRCKVLHQGRSTTDRPGRYSGFVFGQPSPEGYEDHMRLEGTKLHLDVGKLAQEMRSAVEAWSCRLESNPQSRESINVATNLRSLVHVVKTTVPVPSSGKGEVRNTVISKTN